MHQVAQLQPNQEIKIAIADDQALVRESFANALQSNGYIICCQAQDGNNLLDLIFANQPDIVLLDLEMPEKDGWSTLPIIKKQYPEVKVIILTQHAFSEALVPLFDQGANAIISKSLSLHTLLQSIKEVTEKGFSFGPNFTAFLQSKNKTNKLQSTTINSLTDIERNVLNLICKDFLTKDIATELSVTTRTAERYVASLYEKTKTRSPAGLLVFAVKNNLHRI